MTTLGLCLGCAASGANEVAQPILASANQSAVQNISAGQPDLKNYPYGIWHVDPDPEGWVLIRDVKPDLWLVDRIECRGACPKSAMARLKRAKKMPQSFSDPKRRVQYDFVQCEGPMGLWMHTVRQAVALQESNDMVEPKHQSDAKGWGLLRPQANTGFVVCLNPDGSFNKSFTLIDFDGERMVGFALLQILVHYKAVPDKTK